MSVFIEAINWWYTIVANQYLKNKVVGSFVYSMNKTRALPFAKTFNVAMYRDTSDFGSVLSKFIKFWWISVGTIISIVRVIPAIAIWGLVLILPILPVIALLRFVLKI